MFNALALENPCMPGRSSLCGRKNGRRGRRSVAIGPQSQPAVASPPIVTRNDAATQLVLETPPSRSTFCALSLDNNTVSHLQRHRISKQDKKPLQTPLVAVPPGLALSHRSNCVDIDSMKNMPIDKLQDSKLFPGATLDVHGSLRFSF